MKNDNYANLGEMVPGCHKILETQTALIFLKKLNYNLPEFTDPLSIPDFPFLSEFSRENNDAFVDTSRRIWRMRDDF